MASECDPPFQPSLAVSHIGLNLVCRILVMLILDVVVVVEVVVAMLEDAAAAAAALATALADKDDSDAGMSIGARPGRGAPWLVD